MSDEHRLLSLPLTHPWRYSTNKWTEKLNMKSPLEEQIMMVLLYRGKKWKLSVEKYRASFSLNPYIQASSGLEYSLRFFINQKLLIKKIDKYIKR